MVYCTNAGFTRNLPSFEEYDVLQWWKTDLLPKPLRHNTGHQGSHTFLTHEFISALTQNRPPTIDLYETLACTVPGIVASLIIPTKVEAKRKSASLYCRSSCSNRNGFTCTVGL